ncbi:MAG: A/G-specific adenine glycosylase [Chloroflexia bacterium]|nr:A/G-specific adenine glycosylase [Chloroflexia bacterium]
MTETRDGSSTRGCKHQPPAITPSLDRGALAEVQTLLVDWFGREGRDLPWRRTRDPWRILVAEVMLQQIQVARAIPFWEAFVDRFPTPLALAEAQLSAAIRVWGGLGRYRRVVDLHRTARILVADHAGLVPDDPVVLRSLPGIGPYSAGAIACFAFERDVSFVDTNIRRVLHRLFVAADVPASNVTAKEIAAIAAVAVPVGKGWSWNQALMDLGATVCTARKPKCDRCPVSASCITRPTIAAALASTAAAQRKSSQRLANPYEGTNRYYRGRVLEQL